MQSSEVAEVDLLAEQMYSSPDPITRQRAQASLELITKEDANSAIHFTVLQQSTNQYTLLFIAQSFVLWFKSAQKWLSEEQKRELVVVLCGGCLRRAFDNGAPKHVVSSLLTAYAKLTKLAFEKEPFLEVAVEYPLELVLREPEESSLHSLGLGLLNTMVLEFSKYDSSRSQTYLTFVAHRHCSGNFKENCLLNIFMASVKHLKFLTADSPHVSEVVKLVENCLSFDFRAIMVDETEDLPFIQFPSVWKNTLLGEETLNAIWGQQARLSYPHCANLLSGIINICGVHRTFFDSPEERAQYLQYTLGMLTEVTMLQDGRLKIPHYVELLAEACRRLLLSFGYRELHSLSTFEPWITAICSLSIEVLSIPFGREGSFATASAVMGFWVALTTSKRRSYTEQNSRDFEDLLPRVLQAFLGARLRTFEADDPMSMSLNGDDGNNLMETLISQSDAYANVCLLDPVLCLTDLSNYLNQNIGMSIFSSTFSTGWLFYIAGSIMRLVVLNMDEIAVEPCSHVFLYVTGCANHRLRREMDPGMFSGFVERGVLHFLTSVQVVLSGISQGSLSAFISNVFQCRTHLFQFVLDNAGHNLLRDADDVDVAEIISMSANVITDACRDAPPSLLQELNFEFPPIEELPLARSERTYKLRTLIMKALWFLGMKGSYTRERMESYLSTIEVNMQRTANNEVTCTNFVAGWLRDLRGACQALKEDETSFGDFIEWFCTRFPMLVAVLDNFPGSTAVVNALMRLLCEVVTPGKYGRLHILSSSNSAVGLMLFKHICTLIAKVEEISFSNDHIAVLNGTSLEYNKVLKPWMLSMDILKKCVQGSFVPFGAMLYYSDESFENTTVGLLRKLTLLGENVFKEYSKFTIVAVDFLRSIAEEGVYFPLRHLKSEELLALVGVVVVICEDVDVSPGTRVYGLSFLTFIAGLVREVKDILLSPNQRPAMVGGGGTPPSLIPFGYASQQPAVVLPGVRSGVSGRHPRFAREVRKQLAELLVPHQDLWRRLISMAMNIIVFQDRALSASSSVVYPIFEAHPPFWYDFVEELVSTYPERKQAAVREALSALTNGAETQGKFFSEVFTFRQALRRLDL